MRNIEITANNKKDRSLAQKALQGMFPSKASFMDFKENDRHISEQALSSIIHYAFISGVIDEENEKSFIDFLSANDQENFELGILNDFTFSDVLASACGNLSVNILISQLDKVAHTLGMPSVSAPMVTRLKQNFSVNTPKKRALLRLLAFWIAQHRPELGWHYGTLLKIPRQTAGLVRTAKERAGVAIKFDLRGQGEIISSVDIEWLKNELADCLDYVNLSGHLHHKMIERTGTTSFSILFFKKPGAANEPILYDQAIHSALAVAHQMSIRWLLCTCSTPRKRLLMMITAGPIQEDRQPGLDLQGDVAANETGVYLSDFAHLCAEISGIKGFRRCLVQNTHRTAVRGEMWSLIYFWPNHYCDYVPCLLEEKMLPKINTGPAYEAFQQALFFPETNPSGIFGALEAMHRHPQHALHLIEIAKVLHARQMTIESEEFISRVLLVDPENLAARYMRMLSFGHLANREPDIQTSLTAFERGIAEGENLLRKYDSNTEILWATGILNFNQALKLLHYLKVHQHAAAPNVTTEAVIAYLRKSADYFRRGLAASAAGQANACLYWLQYALSFIELLSIREHFFSNGEINPEDDRKIFRQAGLRMLKTMGLLPAGLQLSSDPPGTHGDLGLKAALYIVSKNQNAMNGRSYMPYTLCMLAMILWDFSPLLTVSVGRLVRHLLEQSRRSAIKLMKDNLCVYHVFSGFMPPNRYIDHVGHINNLLKEFISDDDLTRGDDYPIHPTKAQKMSGLKLMLLEVDLLL